MKMSFDDRVRKLNAVYSKVKFTEDDIDDYQWEAIETILREPRFALFIDTGLGKTVIMLFVIRNLIFSGEISKVLVIAPLKVSSRTWPDEIATWSFSAPLVSKQIRGDELIEHVNAAGARERARIKEYGLPTHISRDFDSNCAKRLKKMLADNPGIKIDEDQAMRKIRQQVMKSATDYCVEQVRMDAASDFLARDEKLNPASISLINHENVDFLVEAWGENFPYEMIIYDESSGAKNGKSNRVKALMRVRKKVKRFVQLTATPNSENYLGLWSQMYLLDNGRRLGTEYSSFESRYFHVDKYTRAVTIKPGSAEEITAAIADISMVMKQEDYVEMAPPIIRDIKVTLDANAREKYMAMSDGGVVTVDDVDIAADSVIAMLQKMMQICSGFVYEGVETLDTFGDVHTSRIAHDIHDCKIQALRELRAEFPGEPMLLAYYHKQSLVKLQAAFPDAVRMDAKATQQTAWNKGEIPLLLMHPKSGAHGLNLQHGGRHVVNFDTYFSYEQYYQFWRRLARRGQKEQVYVHNILADDTYDMVVKAQCWVGKKQRQDAFFDMLKKIRRKGMTAALRDLMQ